MRTIRSQIRLAVETCRRAPSASCCSETDPRLATTTSTRNCIRSIESVMAAMDCALTATSTRQAANTASISASPTRGGDASDPSIGTARELPSVCKMQTLGSRSVLRIARRAAQDRGESLMAQTVADLLLAQLRAWNVKQVFGYPGDGINGLLAAWGRADNDPQFVQARHEEMAAFEAVGYAKFSGN